jgi:hypothetical protein
VKIIGADERANTPHGVKLLIAGPTGVGKTSLLRTVDPYSVLLLDSDCGSLAIQDVPVDTIPIDDWQTARDVACRIGGPNPTFSPLNCYSQAHYEKIGGALPNLERYRIIVADSITATSRHSFRWAEQQPEARTNRGEKDTRAVYGLHAREFLLWLHQLQHARDKHVIFIGHLEQVIDDFKRPLGFQVQMEGAKVPREIGAIVDEFIIMEWIKFEGRDEPMRALICTSPNAWNYPAKDRSGRLEQIEEPHLGRLLTKIVERKPAATPKA